FVDPAKSALVSVVGTGIGPHEIAVEPGGARAVVSNYGAARPGSSLTLVDLQKGIPVETIDLGSHRRPHGLAFRAANRVLVTCEASHALVEVDLDARKVVRALTTDQEIAHMVVVSPDGARAFVANIGSGSLSVFDLEQGLLLKSLPTGKGAEGIAITPDGGEVWVTNRDADTLSIVDTHTLEVSATLPSASVPIRVQITPDGSRAVVSNYASGEVAVFDVKARKELARISLAAQTLGDATGAQPTVPPSPVGILIEPSGKRAFIACTAANVIAVLDLEKLAPRGLLRAGREPDGLGWFPR
ncbi:MAG TPA: beta-propeller fold lactonase family protein, partial [Planctomycetota bacterium]|nr:beta-propeller fold lactonase family protein [Planctomycetota bacterium]